MFCPRCHRKYDDDSTFCHFDGEPLLERPSVDRIPVGKTRHEGVVLGGRYQVRGYVGKGAMARVYLAEDLRLGQPVAVKVLDRTAARDPEAGVRFLREARAIQAIGHPNVIEIFDVGERDDGMPYLVMEFLFGESLGGLLKREGRLSSDIALPIARQAADGLAAAHEAGVVHRDVKPDNIFLVGEPGDPYAVKVLDFGLAKLPMGSGTTSAGVAIGTIEYMAPEQVLTEPIDERTDVYGFGVLLYRMFTGLLPFEDEEQGRLLAQQLIVKPPPPSGLVEDLDPGIEALVLWALRKRPEARPTMSALLEDLERLMGERDGELVAYRAPAGDDAYVPRTPFGREASSFLYRKLGLG